MACEICGVTGGHATGCPNYEPPKPKCKCDICGLGIYSGDDIVVNSFGDIAHYECISESYTRTLVNWFGGEFKEME